MELIFYFLAFLIVESYMTKVSFNAPNYQFVNAKKSAFHGFVIITIIALLTLFYLFVIGEYLSKSSEIEIILIRSLFYLIIMLIVIFAVINRKESLQSIGIMKQNLMKSSILGIVLGILFYIFCYILMPDRYSFDILSVHSLISFIGFMILGLAEEMSFRGYLQPRLIAWKGIKKGFMLTAILFSFWHFPVNLAFKGMGMEQAFFSCVDLIPLSMLLGYIMLKTKSIVSVTIFHAFIDWVLHT